MAAQRAPMLQATMDLLDLLGLLEAEDFAALEKFATVREQLLGLPEGLFNALEAALQDLDLAAAGAVCRRILDGAENLSGDGR